MLLGLEVGHKGCSHFGGAHLGLQVVGGNLGRIDKDAVLILERSLAAAVEEECHVGIFFSFGYAQLFKAGGCDCLAQGLLYILFVEKYMQPGEFVVVRSQAAIVEGDGVHPCLGHILLGEDVGDFAGTVVAEVEEDHRIALLDGGHGFSVGANHADGFDEFVGDTFVVGLLYCSHCAGGFLAHAAHYQVIALFHTLPAFIAVHSVVTAYHAGHLAGSLCHLLLQLFHKALAAAGVAVAAVHQAVYEYIFETLLLGNGQEFIEMIQRGVYSAVAREAHEVQCLAALFDIIICCSYLLVGQKLMLAACHIYLDQVLIYYAAAADVEVAHLAVAHLAVGQTHVFAAGAKVRERIFGPQGVDVRLSLGVYCVAVVFFAFAPAIQNH